MGKTSSAFWDTSAVLRSADAFQLAAALVWCANRPRNRTFITMDDKLALAAEEAGFSLLHP